ncbi:MAG: hypothetical protein JXX14_22165 [Deltaproteobacteria bacterium]|nr:hypothetical protein [Deltaproteobacteria bacterium]
MRLVPTKKQLNQSWEKYGLIVVGNIVFFTLLYFISYRPHNEENRASEFLSLAQQAETEDQMTTAQTLYTKITRDYSGTRSAATAQTRLESLRRQHTKHTQLSSPPKPTPVFDIEKMLDQRPAVYVARFLAAHYDDSPKLKPRVRQAIADYLKIAINYDGVLLKTLRTEKEFLRPEFQTAFFSVLTRCEMKKDWIYDDFFIRNNSIFPWHDVRLHVTVSQGKTKESADMRIPALRPGRAIEVASLNVKEAGGDVICQGKLSTREGKATFKNRL